MTPIVLYLTFWTGRMTPDLERFAEKTTPFVRTLLSDSPALRKIYKLDPANERIPLSNDADVMLEKRMTVEKGIICKYAGRALMLLSYTCAAHCRYCERQDRVGVGLDSEGRLTTAEIDAAVAYLQQRTDISEVIFSGGDPLTNMPGLVHASRRLGKLSHIRMLRIHTRFPLQHPTAVKLDMLAAIVDAVPAFYFSLHVDHPDELTAETETVILQLRRMGYLLLSQSVFLNGVNDDIQVLERLFCRLGELGVRPYYIYHCMAIPTTMHFVMDLQKEVELMSLLRQRVSGHCLPTHIIELPGTTGKVAVPSHYWTFDLTTVRDFNARPFSLSSKGVVESSAPASWRSGS